MNYQHVIRLLMNASYQEAGNGFDKFSCGTRRIYDSIHRSRTFDSTGFLLNLLSITGHIERSKSFVLLTVPSICHRCRKILLVSLIRDFLPIPSDRPTFDP